MKPGSVFSSGQRQIQLMAALGYLLTILSLASTACWMASELYADHFTVDELRDRLSFLDARGKASTLSPFDGDTETRSPFIEGATMTQAGAALQQRVDRAAVRVGGSILASQLQLEDPQAKTGLIKLMAELEIAQPALQGFLYDLEAGMPYLFVDALSVQSPPDASEQGGARMHVSISVSGQWQALQ